MVRKLMILSAMLALTAASASAQDARAVLQASRQGDGRHEPQDDHYSGAGWSSRIGQTYGLTEDWPKYEVADYTRVIDYDASWSREDYTGGRATTRRSAARRWRSSTSRDPERHVRLGHAERHAPCRCRVRISTASSYSDLRQLELALTPHGALKAGARGHQRHRHHAAHRRRDRTSASRSSAAR